MLDGYADVLKSNMRMQAWTVSHLLVAAGCDPGKVTPAKLLGEKEKRERMTLDPEERKRRAAERVWKKMQEKKNG